MMATSKSDEKSRGINALYWMAGIAATAGVYYFATRYLRERDELMEMHLMKKLQTPESNPSEEED